MGLMEQLKDLPKTNKISMDDLSENPLIKAVEQPTIDDIKEEPKKEEPKPEKENKEPEEGGEIEAKDEKPEVKGYKGRKINEYKEDLQRERERADRLEKALLEKQPAPKIEAREVEPDPATDPDKFVEYALRNGISKTADLEKQIQGMKMEQAYNAAGAELARMEQSYTKDNPQYAEALEYVTNQEIARKKILNPNVNEAQLRKQMERERIQVAAHFEGLGKNAVESLFELMKNSGYSPKETSETQENARDEGKNFDAVRKNKAKSATSLAAGGKSGSVETGPESARTIKLSEFSKLSKEQKDRIYKDRYNAR